jgi:hypothetical protein
MNQGTKAQAERLTKFLERNWNEELLDTLSDEFEAALGLALARALSRGWIETQADLKDLFDATEEFMARFEDDE